MTFTEACELGSAMIKLNPTTWLGPDNDCGCPVGMAAYALGIRKTEHNHPELEVFKLYPWLEEYSQEYRSCQLQRIGGLAFGVARGRMTFAQMIEIIRAMDPDEQNKLSAHNATEEVLVAK